MQTGWTYKCNIMWWVACEHNMDFVLTIIVANWKWVTSCHHWWLPKKFHTLCHLLHNWLLCGIWHAHTILEELPTPPRLENSPSVSMNAAIKVTRRTSLNIVSHAQISQSAMSLLCHMTVITSLWTIAKLFSYVSGVLSMQVNHASSSFLWIWLL